MPEVHIPDAPLITTPSESSEVPGIVCLRVKVPENASPKEKQSAEEVNSILYGYYKLGGVIRAFFDNPISLHDFQDGKPSPRLIKIFNKNGTTMQNFDRVIGLSRILLHINDLTGKNVTATSEVLQNGIKFLSLSSDEQSLVHHFSDISTAQQHEVKQMLRAKTIHALQIPNDEYITFQDISFTEGASEGALEDALEIMRIKLQKTTHELASNANLIGSMLSPQAEVFPKEQRAELCQNTLNILFSGYELSQNILKENYQREFLTVGDISPVITSTLTSCFVYSDITPNVDIPPEIKKWGTWWSTAWITSLTRNIAQNSLSFIEERKQREPDLRGKFIVQANLIQIHNTPHLQITFTDNGTGFDGRLLNGFQHGLTIRPKGQIGHGHGMAANNEALAKYGGTLQSENVYDAQGNRDGAKIIVTIPIQP